VQSAVKTRRVTLEDLDELFATVQAGFDSYVDFAPAGWRPPVVPADRLRSAKRLADRATWAVIAIAEGRSIGHVAFFPAPTSDVGQVVSEPKAGDVVPVLAHFWQLFVMPEWWGGGVAPLLHDAAVNEMRARGYRSARLFTPTLNARARRFYERRGWSAAEEDWGSELALMVTEYRLAIT
jgi:GNAT superfamily N-acetyltransferase